MCHSDHPTGSCCLGVSEWGAQDGSRTGGNRKDPAPGAGLWLCLVLIPLIWNQTQGWEHLTSPCFCWWGCWVVSELSCGDYRWDFFKLLSEWLCTRNEPLGYPVPSQFSRLWKGKKPKPLFCTHCDFLNIIIPLGLFWFYMISHFPKFSSLPLNITVNPFTHLQLGKSAFCLTLCDKPTLKMLFFLPLAF